MPRKTPDEVEELVVGICKATNYGLQRIAKTLHRKQGIILCYGAVQKMLKRRNEYKPRKKTTMRRTAPRYYNPLDFAPFEFIQMDVKVVVDRDTLLKETYLHFKELVKRGVPLYQFTALDIRTRIRFLAHRQEKSFSNGWAFIVFVVLWLRSLGIKVKITIQTDWGDEFGADDGKKIAWMNQQLARLGRKLPASIKAVKKKMVMLNKATGLTKRLCRNSAQILHYSLP